MFCRPRHWLLSCRVSSRIVHQVSKWNRQVRHERQSLWVLDRLAVFARSLSLNKDGVWKFMKDDQVSKSSLIIPRILTTNNGADMRLPSSKAAAQQRSINLAMSSRGIAALRAVDPKASQRFLRSVIPMRGRMIHGLHGELQSQPYDRDGQVTVLSTAYSLTPWLIHFFLPLNLNRSYL